MATIDVVACETLKLVCLSDLRDLAENSSHRQKKPNHGEPEQEQNPTQNIQRRNCELPMPHPNLSR